MVKKSNSQTKKFCRCIKSVRNKIKSENGAIAICVKSVLQTKGKTLKRFKCGKKPYLLTQKLKTSLNN